MYPRTNYEMTEDDLKELLDACKPTPCFMVGNYTSPAPQDNANRAWRILGNKMGFDYLTVRPIEGKGMKYFSAVPSETETQRGERLKRETEEKRLLEIKILEGEITELQAKLDKLR